MNKLLIALSSVPVYMCRRVETLLHVLLARLQLAFRESLERKRRAAGIIESAWLGRERGE